MVQPSGRCALISTIKKVLWLGFGAGALCGCVSHQYKVILRNEQVIPALTRPKLDKATATYSFKDVSGKRVVIPAYHIREIEIR